MIRNVKARKKTTAMVPTVAQRSTRRLAVAALERTTFSKYTRNFADKNPECNQAAWLNQRAKLINTIKSLGA